MAETKYKPAEPGKIRSSITNKLGRKMFFRLLGLFISLNIFICVVAGATLMIFTGNRVNRAIELLETTPPPEIIGWQNITGFDIRLIPDTVTVNHHNWPRSGRIWPFGNNLANDTDIIYRGFRASELFGYRNTVRNISYIVGVRAGGVLYEIDVRIGTFILYFSYAMLALIFIELMMLISRAFDDRKLIRKTLDPIAELAKAAETLNEVNRQLDHEKMMALAGRLDGIDAGRLDTRIQVDELQDELKNVAVAINGMLDRINESYAAQARFVSDASHELRTPIAVIQGYANLLDRWGTKDEKALLESVTAIKDEADSMKELVEQLLFLARGDSNRINLVPEQVELSELISEVVEQSRLIDDEHEFKIDSDDISITADRGLLKQALRILIDNAIKYSDKGGEIKISVKSHEKDVKLSVSDNGIGINPESLPKVFDRFFRSDESRTRATGGAGLGLAIAHHITTRHNGHMDIMSREDIGTRVTLVLPKG